MKDSRIPTTQPIPKCPICKEDLVHTGECYMTNPPMYGWYCEPEYHYTCVTHANSTKIYREKFTPKDKDYQVRLSNTDCLGVGRDVLLISFDCPKEALDYALNESRSISNRNRKTTKIYVKAKNT